MTSHRFLVSDPVGYRKRIPILSSSCVLPRKLSDSDVRLRRRQQQRRQTDGDVWLRRQQLQQQRRRQSDGDVRLRRQQKRRRQQ